MPKVSIVLPTHNGEQYIRQSIESVIKQSFLDWELIVINDYSSDLTAKIVQEYSRLDNRVKLVENESNLKLPKSLNKGFSIAQGEYLTWTSDDNIFLPDAIQEMQDYLDKNHNIYMVCAEMDLIDKANNTISHFMQYSDDKVCIYNCIGACFMYRRDVIKQIGGYDENMIYVEDYDYWLRIIQRYGTIGFINKTLYWYRFHKDSLTIRKSKEIKKNLACMRKKYWHWIYESIRTHKADICQIYYEFLEAGADISDIEKDIYTVEPRLKGEICIHSNSKRIIIFGAGSYGRKVFNQIADRTEYFADNDVKKVGQEINGTRVIKVSEMLDRKHNYIIYVAVSCEKIYELLQQLWDNGVEEFCTYQGSIIQ